MPLLSWNRGFFNTWQLVFDQYNLAVFSKYLSVKNSQISLYFNYFGFCSILIRVKMKSRFCRNKRDYRFDRLITGKLLRQPFLAPPECLTLCDLTCYLSRVLLFFRFINARRRILQPMLESSNVPPSSSDNKTQQHSQQLKRVKPQPNRDRPAKNWSKSIAHTLNKPQRTCQLMSPMQTFLINGTTIFFTDLDGSTTVCVSDSSQILLSPSGM